MKCVTHEAITCSHDCVCCLVCVCVCDSCISDTFWKHHKTSGYSSGLSSYAFYSNSRSAHHHSVKVVNGNKHFRILIHSAETLGIATTRTQSALTEMVNVCVCVRQPMFVHCKCTFRHFGCKWFSLYEFRFTHQTTTRKIDAQWIYSHWIWSGSLHTQVMVVDVSIQHPLTWTIAFFVRLFRIADVSNFEINRNCLRLAINLCPKVATTTTAQENNHKNISSEFCWCLKLAAIKSEMHDVINQGEFEWNSFATMIRVQLESLRCRAMRREKKKMKRSMRVWI